MWSESIHKVSLWAQQGDVAAPHACMHGVLACSVPESASPAVSGADNSESLCVYSRLLRLLMAPSKSAQGGHDLAC